SSVIEEQITLRDNAIAQSDLLMEYKKHFVRHPSHHYAFKNNSKLQTKNKGEGESKKRKGGNGLLNIFTTMLYESLSKIGSSRTSADHLTIELVLHLIRNLLAISPINTFGSPEKSQYASQLHRELLIVLEEEDVLDLLMVLAQEVERRENQGYNLLLLEIMSCLLRGQDPSDVALSNVEAPIPTTLTAPVTLSNKKKSKTPTKTRIVRTTTTTSRASAFGGGGANSLKAHLQSERNKLQLSASSRHSHFGGTLRITKPGGKQSYVSASDYLAQKAQKQGGGVKGSSAGIAAPARRKNKKVEVFIGSGKASSAHSRPGASATFSREDAGPNSKRAKRALNSFCAKFFEDCYGPMMKSLKNEFRRDSTRLENGDKIMFFRIVWFFQQWWRVSQEQNKKENDALEKKTGTKSKADGSVGKDSESSSAHNLIFSMDVFMFNLVLNSTDEFFEHKKPAALAQTVALYTEMIHMLHAMYDSNDSTERMMALGLMDRLYYGTEPLDRLPKLLSRWSPGMFSREYLCDLVECTHVMWKLLDTNAQRCLQSVSENESERKRPKDAVERMNLTASEFDRDHYFMRKFVSNQIVFIYTQLLSQYGVNAAHINRHIAAYFIRICKFTIKSGDHGDDMDFDDALGKNELATKQSTMEPILYNIGLFTILDKVLNDTTIRDRPDFSALLMFASSFMKRFARAAEVNPMLYVEAMFKHPIPHRFCELSTNLYVNEELRMIAVRDLLLEDQKRYEHQEEEADAPDNNKDEDEDEAMADDEKAAVGYDDDEEEELEFNGDDDDDDEEAEGAVRKKHRRKSKKSRKGKVKSKTATTEDEEQSNNEEEEAEFKGNDDGEDANAKEDDQDEESEPQDEDILPEASSPLGKGTPANDSTSPKLSGKKRIRKSLEAAGNEDSDDEDFLGSAAPVTKVTKRVIFDDDDE
ncbi:hypothetical protein ACHAXR_004387, partial [Thalassiosira sp. AJA248-18]